MLYSNFSATCHDVKSQSSTNIISYSKLTLLDAAPGTICHLHCLKIHLQWHAKLPVLSKMHVLNGSGIKMSLKIHANAAGCMEL